VRDAAEPSEPEPRSIVIVAELPCETAFAITTPDGDRVCIVDRRARGAAEAHENAHRTFWGLLEP